MQGLRRGQQNITKHYLWLPRMGKIQTSGVFYMNINIDVINIVALALQEVTHKAISNIPLKHMKAIAKNASKLVGRNMNLAFKTIDQGMA